MEYTRCNEHDDDCCALCASARSRAGAQGSQRGKTLTPDRGPVPANPGGERYLHFGSYALPRRRILVFAAALILWVLGFVLLSIIDRGTLFRISPRGFRFLPLIPLLAAYALAGLPVLRNALANIRRGKALDENFLMSLATIGAFVIGEWEEAVGVMIFYMIGELIQEAAVVRSRSSIDALLALKPDMARVKTGETWAEISAGGVEPGALVLVRPGERIPLDGIVREGAGSVDASMLTGESRPVAVGPGQEVRSGTISVDSVLVIKTTKTADNSSAAKIIELVESAAQAKAKPERFITSFARWYTPLVVLAAFLLGLLPPLLIPGAAFSDWIYRALILLVISCPCALVVSIPLGYFAGIGGLSRRGIMVKGAVHLDSLNKTDYVAFDKTGTLTEGKFTILALESGPGTDEKLLLEAAVLAEKESNHPIAEAIRRGAAAAGIEASLPPGALCREIAGQGLELRFEDQTILAGNRRLLESAGVILPDASLSGDSVHTSVYIARNGGYCGRILIGDNLKEGAGEAVEELKTLGIRKTLMFTGDTRETALAAASGLGITAVGAELLPEDKLEEVEKLTQRGTTVFVGDGINDAPVLARSEVGIAMGSGADVALEAADVIIMTDDPRRVPEAIRRARKTRRIVMGNVAFALGTKGMFIVLAALGMANMWVALIADVGVALAAILNSARALR